MLRGRARGTVLKRRWLLGLVLCVFAAVPASASAESLPGLWAVSDPGGGVTVAPQHVGTASFGAPLTATPVSGKVLVVRDDVGDPLDVCELLSALPPPARLA
jgi:hypothetical protein